MKRSTAVLLVLSLSSVLFAQDADILKVIPEKSLVAVVVRNVDGAETHLRELVEKFDGKLPEGGLFDAVLKMFDIRTEDPADLAKAATIDLKGPMALVMVVPAHHIPGKPVGVVVKAADYKKLLNELARVADAPAVEVTPDGTDVVKGETGTGFAAQIGPYAVLAEAEYVIKTFQAEVNRSLHVSNVKTMGKTVTENDFAVYVNLDDVVKAFDPQIAAFRRMMKMAVENAPDQPGMPADPEARVRTFDAQVDLMLKLAQQTDMLCVGLKTNAAGARTVVTCRARPNSVLARVLAQIEPAPVRMLDTFDGPTIMAGEYYVRPEAAEAAQELVDKFLLNSGTVKDTEALKTFHEKLRKQRARTTGRFAFVWAPPEAGKGIVRLIVVEETKPGAEPAKKKLDEIMNLKQNLGQFKMEVDLQEKVETHRNTSIDLAKITFKGTRDAEEGVDQALKIIRALFGPAMVIYGAEAGGRSVGTVGYETSGALKTQIDRILDKKHGSLLTSQMWREAVAKLPAKRSAVMTLSVAEFYKVILPPMMEAHMPELAERFRKVEFERDSAAGISFGPVEGGAILHMNVPVQEMLNVREVFMVLIKMMTDVGRRAGGAE